MYNLLSSIFYVRHVFSIRPQVIVRNSDALLLLLYDVLYERTYKEVKQESAQCIAIVGQVMGPDAHRYIVSINIHNLDNQTWPVIVAH